jgi:hypothetical protein
MKIRAGDFETSPRKKATMAERAETLLISENKTLVRELACDGKFSVKSTACAGRGSRAPGPG